MPYLLLIRYISIIVIIGSLIFSIYNKGVKDERALWESKALETQVKIKAEELKQSRKVLAIQEENSKLLLKIERISDEKEKEIDELTNKLSNSNRVYKSSLCTGSTKSGLSKDSGSTLPSKETSDSTTISEGFRNDLIRTTKRADQVGIYSEEAYEWIKEMCKNEEQFICQ